MPPPPHTHTHVGCQEHREELERIGLDFERREVGDWEKVKNALLRYKTLKGDLEIIRDFVGACETCGLFSRVPRSDSRRASLPTMCCSAQFP